MRAVGIVAAVALALLPFSAWAQPGPGPGAGCPRNASTCTVTATGGTTHTLADWEQAFSYPSGTNLQIQFGPNANPYASLGVSTQVVSSGASAIDLIGLNGSNSGGGGGYLDNLITYENDSISYWYSSITCTITSGSAVVSGCSDISNALVGNFIQSALFPAGSKIASGLTSTGFTASANATGNGGTLSIEKQCGNAAVRFRGPNTGLSTQRYERGAVGYSTTGDGCQGFFPNSVYVEIGNIGPAADPNDTSFILVSTHGAGATHFANTSYKGFQFSGSLGDFTFSDHTGATMLSITESSKTVNVPTAAAFGTTSAPAAGVVLEAVGTQAAHFDCTGANTATAVVLSAECNSGTNGIRYIFGGQGATTMGYNGGGVLATDGSSIRLTTGSSVPGSGTTSLTAGAGLLIGAATGGLEGAGTVNAAGAYYSNGTIGVTCAGAPTGSFASTLGIVTHC